MGWSVSDAWIGVIGGAVGALAGLFGAWLTVFLTTRSERRNEIREAAVDLIAKASYPDILRKALSRGSISGDRLAALAIDWTEELTRARARLAILAPSEVVSTGDFLWQRATDHMNALLEEHAKDEIDSLGIEVFRTMCKLEEVTGRELGHGRRWLQRGLD